MRKREKNSASSLAEAYQESAREDAEIIADWDPLSGEGIP